MESSAFGGKPEELLERLQKYLDRTEREGMITRELLVALRTDLTQVVYAWLSEREIKAYALFADADMENLHRNSLYGREEMMEYAGVLVRKAVQYRQYINKSDSVTSQVCAYIDAHYREEIHREELGELVFLNTDYLSRIFKKERVFRSVIISSKSGWRRQKAPDTEHAADQYGVAVCGVQ